VSLQIHVLSRTSVCNGVMADAISSFEVTLMKVGP
jgi:hypothetical protein